MKSGFTAVDLPYSSDKLQMGGVAIMTVTVLLLFKKRLVKSTVKGPVLQIILENHNIVQIC